MSEWKKVKLGEISKAIQTGPFGSHYCEKVKNTFKKGGVRSKF